MANPLRGPVRADLLRDETLSDVFEATVRRTPDAPAIVDQDRRLTYAALDAAAGAVAAGLVARGIGPGDVVGLWLPRGSDLLVAQIAVTKAGAAWLPFDADAPVERIGTCLADAAAKALLVAAEWTGCARAVPVPALTLAATAEGRAPLAAGRRPGLTPDHPAYLIYTSGSTGTPKGIVVTHRNICHYLRASNALYDIQAHDVVLQACSAAFDLSMEEIWVPYLAGATLWVARQELMSDPEALARAMRAAGITVIDTVPTLLAMLDGDLPALRLVILGGEACPPELVTRFAHSGRRLFNSYGPTEATVVATMAALTPGAPVTIGGPIPNYSCYVVDAAMQLVPPGVPGELLIGGPGIARGYLGRPDLTAEKFIANPFSGDGGDPVLYRSGDAVAIDAAGTLVFRGRTDDQVKIRGFRVEPGEIEAVLTDLPGIAQAAVILRSDDGIDKLVAFIGPQPGTTPDPAQLRLALRARLPAYMVPAAFEVMGAFPRLAASGKIDRKALKTVPLTNPGLPLEQDEPQTATEAELLAAAQRVFPDQVIPLDADFFMELGGHSLLAARFVSFVRERPHLASITLRDMYDARTLRAMAVLLEGRLGMEESPPDVAFAPPPLRRRFLCGLAQAAALPFILTLMSAPWLCIFIGYTLITGDDASTWLDIAVMLSAFMAVNVVTSIVAVAAKWLLVGRTKPGRYPLWGTYHYRIWLAQRFLSLVHIKWFQGSPAIRIYLRLLGAKIGKEVVISPVDVGAIDLLTIGDNASIGSKVTFANVRVVGNELIVGRVTIGRDVMIGSSCVLEENITIGEGAEITDLSAIAAGTTIPAWEGWQGSPARKQSDLDPADLRAPAETGAVHRALLTVFYITMLTIIPPIALLPIVPAFHIMERIDAVVNPLIGINYLYYMPILALSAAAIMIFATALMMVGVRWLIMPGRLKAGETSIYSGLYVRKWTVGLATEVMLEVLSSLFATVYMRVWYRMMGAKIGKGTEVSTNLAGRFDLVDLGDNNFIADDVVLIDEDIRRGWMTLGTVKTGSQVFIGNDGVVPPGATIANNALIGVKSKPPASNDVAEGETWFGSPPIKLPVRQRFAAAAGETYAPTKYLLFERAVFEAFNVSFPTAIFITCATIAMEFLYPSVSEGRWGMAILLCIAASVFIGVAQLLVSAGYKWLLMGIYKPTMRPMWSWWARRTEAVSVMYWGMAGKAILEHFRGTPFLPWALRLFGVKTGRGIYMDTADITEFDCVTIGDFAAVNTAAVLQTHLYEDRLMKVGRIHVGAGVTVGAGSTVLYDTNLGDYATLGPLTLVMKGESIPAGSHWAGAPAQPRAKADPAKAQPAYGIAAE